MAQRAGSGVTQHLPNSSGQPKHVCGQVKCPKHVCLVAWLGEQLLEKQILKIILEVLWQNDINSYQYNMSNSSQYTMSNTSFHFRQTFLLSAHSSQSHATSYLSLMSHDRVNNKCNMSKRLMLKMTNLCNT